MLSPDGQLKFTTGRAVPCWQAAAGPRLQAATEGAGPLCLSSLAGGAGSGCWQAWDVVRFGVLCGTTPTWPQDRAPRGRAPQAPRCSPRGRVGRTQLAVRITPQRVGLAVRNAVMCTTDGTLLQQERKENREFCHLAFCTDDAGASNYISIAQSRSRLLCESLFKSYLCMGVT